MVYGEYWGSGYSNKYRKFVKFHWTSTAANIPNQLEYIKDLLDIDGNISYHFIYNSSTDQDALELGELGANL